MHKLTTNKKISETVIYSVIFSLIGFFFLFYLYKSFSYPLPLGTDGVTAFWPLSHFLDKTTSIEGFFKVLHAVYMGEDHVTPIRSLVGYISYQFFSDPVLAMSILSKILLILIVTSSLLVVYQIWEDKQRVILLFLILTFNLSLTVKSMVFPNFSVSILLSIWSFSLLVHFFKTGKLNYLILFGMFFCASTLSMENSFISIPLFLIFPLFFVFKENTMDKDMLKRIVLLYFIICLSLIPYILIHYWLYGIPLPSSRISLFSDEDITSKIIFFAKMLAWLFSTWSFGIVRAFYDLSVFMTIIPSIIIIYISIKIIQNRLMTRKGVFLLFSLVAQLILIMYTGRYHGGIWLFAGVVFCMILVDVLSQALNKSLLTTKVFGVINIKYISVIIAIPVLFITNIFIQPYDILANDKKTYDSVLAGYKAVNENADRLVVVRLPSSDELFIHPKAFWMGNKMYHDEPALWYYPNYHGLMFKNMNVEYYNNTSNYDFDYFLEFIVPKPGSKEVVVFRGENLFYRIFLDKNERQLLRAAIISDYPQESFNINLPDLQYYSTQRDFLEVSLKFSDIPDSVNEIYYGNSIIKKWRVEGNKIIFITKNLNNSVDISINKNLNNLKLELIEVNFPIEDKVFSEKAADITENYIMLGPYSVPIKYSIVDLTDQKSSEYPDFIINGTLDANKSIKFDLLVSDREKSSLVLEYSTFESNRKKRMSGKIKIDEFYNKPIPLVNLQVVEIDI